MSDATLWWLAAGALIAAELVSGTFYLLMLALGLAAAALAAHAGLPLPWQWLIGAGVGGGSVLLWRQHRLRAPAAPPAQANHDLIMDIGESVHVAVWNDDGTCRVKYRGTLWQAALLPGQLATSGTYTIAEVVGNRLLLQKDN